MIKHIFVPLDGSDTAEAAVPHAAALAKLLDARVTLARVPEAMIVPVVDAGVWITRVVESREAAERSKEYLAQVAEDSVWGDASVDTVLPHYPVAEGLLDAIDDLDVGLVVMTTHGRSGPDRWLMGSVAQKLVHHAPASMFVLRNEAAQRDPAFSEIMVPLDGSDLAASALEPASELAQRSGGQLHLVTVPTVPPYAKVVPETSGMIPDLLKRRIGEAESYLSQTVADLEDRGIEVDANVEVVVAGDVAKGIVEHADEVDADLILMSTHGRTGLGRFILGSVTDRVLRGSRRPLWILRPDAQQA